MSVPPPGLLTDADARSRLETVSELMRDLSAESDPQRMVAMFGEGMKEQYPRDRLVSVSRRDLEPPRYKITRSDLWDEVVNPWTDGGKLPEFDGGYLGELLYAGDPLVIPELEVPAGDPAAEYFEGMRSMIAIPVWDGGEVINMVFMMKRTPDAYEEDDLAEIVLRSNLFGATKTLVLQGQLETTLGQLDRELRIVADIQRSLLPRELPSIPSLDLAASYETSRYAGGDYYDFFPLADGKWGVLIADVCGHGTPAAVLMAITHSLAHTYPEESCCPGHLLTYVNRHLSARYVDSGGFVTAFFGVYDPEERTLTYTSAGHNPPRLKRCSDGTLHLLEEARNLPLGIVADVEYERETVQLIPGDQLLLYTDGITEARNAEGELFGVERLDAVLANCGIDAQGLIDSVLEAVEDFTGGLPADDDRTMVVGKVR